MYFWEGFNNKNNFFIDILLSHNIEFKLCENIDELDYIIFGCFILNYGEKKKLLNYPSHIKKILYITEALSVFYHVTWDLFLNGYFNYISGSIQNNSNTLYYKLPLYIIYFDYKNANFYNDVNNYVLNQDISSKKNICIINSHDIKNSRTPIYNSLLSKGVDIVCPGKLFNNASNEELNSIGKQEYLKRFIFNICPENTKTLPNGYITEKLLECCKSGCIPIYCGSFDDIDEKIFNKNRIIFYDYESEESITNCCIKVIELLNDKNKLETFYKQHPFIDTAYDTLINLENNLFNIFK